MWLKTTLLAATALSLSGCASVSYKTIGFDVLRAADYTLPTWADTILLVDNVGMPTCIDSTLPPDDVRLQNEMTAYARSICESLFRSLRAEFKSSGYMGMRYADVPVMLTERTIDSLLTGHPHTVILSMDSLSSLSVLRIADNRTSEDNEVMGCIDIVTQTKTQMTLRTSPYDAQALTPRTDTIVFESCGSTTADVVNGFPTLGMRYKNQGSDVGRIYASELLPTWQRVYRNIYVTNKQDMAAAAIWVEKGEWEEAKNLWARAYDSQSKTADKVRAAINLAVAFEREDAPAEASMWCSKALDLMERCDTKTQNSLKIEKEKTGKMFEYFMSRMKEKETLDKQMN